MLKSGKMDVVTLQKILGHSSLAMISRTDSHLTGEDLYEAMMLALETPVRR